MGQGASVVDKSGKLRIYEYPYTIRHKFMQFPFKFHWQYSRMLRYMFFGVVVASPFFLFMQNALTGKGNKEMWKAKREHYLHSHFDPPRPISDGKAAH